MFNNPINEVEFKLRNLDKLNEISQNLKKEGKTDIKLKINNKEKEFVTKIRIDSSMEWEYYKNEGILNYVLNKK